ncbi:MAG: S-methyl-5'-thioinosine phosphorylase [Gammaproteobacteria bacterium]|nr:MAG: S-methyl-5'-thioinosine phosphorylase [Gammaproteobacteria bacterium]
MTKLAIIGGTGFSSIDELSIDSSEFIDTPYGISSAPLIMGELAGKEVVFIARHGLGHTIPPHKINYCANIWALKSVGVTHVIGVAAVGGIHDDIPPKKIVIPDQIIDYTYDRKHTFFEENLSDVTHIDFTHPYSEELRQKLIRASIESEIDIYEGGVYGATQGPRLETAAEIIRMQKDGCDIVGMTGMPEASLAKELGLKYACCALSVNWAAGIGGNEITMQEIKQAIDDGMVSVNSILVSAISN